MQQKQNVNTCNRALSHHGISTAPLLAFLIGLSYMYARKCHSQISLLFGTTVYFFSEGQSIFSDTEDIGDK